jgi:sigma-54 dependent transcriptional regulator, acetoin dehydrogenase operon transcriptional activator AcoR
MTDCNCPLNHCPVHGMVTAERALEVLRDAMARPTLAQIIANAIADALARHGGNVSAAARELGINRRTIYHHQKGVAQRQVNPSMLGRSRS